MEVLRLGTKGADVGRVQRALNERMLPPNNSFTRPPLAKLAEDNIFGARTQAMVREFQRLNRIALDGTVGKHTSYLLSPLIAFTTVLAGTGPLRGTSRPGFDAARLSTARFLLPRMALRFPVLVADVRAFAVGEGDSK